MNIAVITAGGSGQRMGQDIPKQFISVYDKPVIVYTLDAFQKHPGIDEIFVVCISGWADTLKAYAKQFGITKLKDVFLGGNTGFESIRNAVDALKKDHSENDVVLIHDAIRPMLSADIISNNLATCSRFGNAVTTIPSLEAVLFSEDGRASSNKSIPRETLARTQTPQTFALKNIAELYAEAKEKGVTDSVAPCTLMVDLGKTVYLCAGSEKNIKLTTVEDMDIFKALLNNDGRGWMK